MFTVFRTIRSAGGRAPSAGSSSVEYALVVTMVAVLLVTLGLDTGVRAQLRRAAACVATSLATSNRDC